MFFPSNPCYKNKQREYKNSYLRHNFLVKTTKQQELRGSAFADSETKIFLSSSSNI